MNTKRHFTKKSNFPKRGPIEVQRGRQKKQMYMKESDTLSG